MPIYLGPYQLSESEDSFSPPESARNAAKKVLKWKEEHGSEVKAMTATGWTRARQLASGEKLSYNTVKRMARFERHRSNSKINPEYKNEPWRDNGYVAWLGWGGDSGIAWAKRIVAKKESINESKYSDVIDRDGEPKNKKLWEKAVEAAKQKFDVYPSAYANAWAVKWYKKNGGKY